MMAQYGLCFISVTWIVIVFLCAPIYYRQFHAKSHEIQPFGFDSAHTQYTPTDRPTKPNKHGRIVMRECVIWLFFRLIFFPLFELSFYLPKYFQCVACMHANLCVVNYRSNDENACQTHIKHTHSLLKQTWKILSDGIVIRLICSTFFLVFAFYRVFALLCFCKCAFFFQYT